METSHALLYEGLLFNIFELDIETNYTIDATPTHLRYKKIDEKNLLQYGEGPFCKFRIHEYLGAKGVYAFLVDKEVKYIGRCLNTFGKRINNGYGNISPRNCYQGGQATNCHVNHMINLAKSQGSSVEIGLCCMDDDALIKQTEDFIIRKNLKDLPWNAILAPQCKK